MYPNNQVIYSEYSGNDERFFLAPFLFGGLAGTALGYGIANNNHQNTYPIYPMYPVYPTAPIIPTYSSYNYYY